MKVCACICELNPFHNGHEYLFREARRITGADHIVAVMSGDFVQRGLPAICDKYTRTSQALMGGADLVIEIEDTGEGISDDDAANLRRKMEEASIDELKAGGRIGIVNACLRLKIATEGNVRFMIESEKGIGTTVTVTVPREYVHEKSIAR